MDEKFLRLKEQMSTQKLMLFLRQCDLEILYNRKSLNVPA